MAHYKSLEYVQEAHRSPAPLNKFAKLFSNSEFSAVITMLYFGWKKKKKKASHPGPRSLSWLYLSAAKICK
jgi:hypothetical protein